MVFASFCKRVPAYLFIISLFVYLPSSFGQGQKTFSSDHTVFLEELTDFFESADKKPGREFMEQFVLTWNSGKLGATEKETVIKTCNLMLKKRLKAFPDFKNYLGSIVSFANSSTQDSKSFAAWQVIIDKILNGKSTKNFTDFLSMSDNLFATNTFYKSASTEWRSSNSNYTFEYDSVPKVVFQKMNLKCYSKGDSAIIQNTVGVYYPSIQRFFGNGGKVNWLRANIPEDESWAELKRYTIAVKSTEYVADSVTYYNKKYFTSPLLGVLHEKVLADMQGEKATYPRFDSYTKKFRLNNLLPGVDYSGGISIVGARLQGSGSKEEAAMLTFKRNDKIFLKALANTFLIRPERIASDRASIVCYLDKDSIYHPGLQLKLNIKEKFLELYRDEQGISKSPYYNNYHNIDMYFEDLYWKLDTPKIDLKMLIGSSLGSATFESSNYYREIRYARLQGLDDVHPLVKIRNFSKSFGSESFPVEDLARYMRISPDQVRPLLLKLATGGFLVFDIDADKVTLKDRLNTYILARGGKTDYDVIEFKSTTAGQVANASINLLNYDMTIRGVNEIFLSDSQNVYVYPKNETIILKKNRNFTFSGLVNAGRFEFFGKEFSFEYDKFKLNLTNIDSMRMFVRSNEKNENGEYPLVRVRTVVENMNGELIIDNFNNKSGVQSYPHYPTFISKKPSFVYYDRKSIQKGVYSRDKFYFKLDPFTFDSLKRFTNEGLTFDGTFSSASIFPDFQEKLTLQPDYSLGFVRSTPPDGMPLYGNKGKFTDKIKLSNEGLKGDGTLNYVTSTSRSNNFIFYPDSMNAVVQSYEIAQQTGKVEFPPVKAENVYTHWMPKRDVMSTSKIDRNMSFYDGQAEMAGTVHLRPEGLSGNGTMSFAKSELTSNLMKYRNKGFDADTASFRMASEEMSELAFATDNVKANIDFEKRVGDFKSNGGGTYVKFPVNQYISFMDQFKWFMDQGAIELSAEGKKAQNPTEESDIDLTGAEFISTHPQQDSLRFFSPRAKYDSRKNIIYAKEVKYVNVADARVYPDSGNIVIYKKARIETLNNAKILANTATKYHNLYNGTLNIYGRKSYSGSADYDYLDEVKKVQKIHFTNLFADTTGQTTAEGEILDSAQFTLSPNFAYFGKVNLFASKQFLVFTGSSRIEHSCSLIPKSWFRFSAEIDPENIYIPVSKEPVDSKGDKIAAGVLLTNDSTHVYSAFMSRKENYSDNLVLSSDGYLHYDKAAKEYKISNKEKIREISLPGQYLSLNTDNCILYGDGVLNLGTNLGQIKSQTVGNVNHNLNTDSVKFDMVMSLDFFFDESLIKSISENIEKSSNASVNLSRLTFEKALRELLGKTEADKLISQVSLYGSFKKFPSELEHTFMFNDLKMKWNTPTRSYVSEGMIGVGSIYKNQLNKYVKGKIELVKKRSGDILNMYLEVDNSTWYFFNYQAGLMQAISSDEKFNTTIKELKPDKRKAKEEKGQPAFQFVLSTARKKADFLKKFDAQE